MNHELPSRFIDAEKFGGEEDQKEEDDRERISCDKRDHAVRSLYNQPNHAKHWGQQKIQELTK